MASDNQHYVWQHYVRAWCDNKGRVHFKRKGNDPLVTNPKNIMAEKGFYKLRELDRLDLRLLESYIAHSGSPSLRQTHRNLLRMFVLIVEDNKLTQSNNQASPDEKKKAQDLVVKAEDMLHGGIEKSAIPVLDDLRHGRNDFINSDESAMIFFFYLAQQYCRTKAVREPIKEYCSRLSAHHNFANVANIMCYIAGTNIGGSLYGERKNFDVVFVECGGNNNFVTGDQPVINLMANRHGGDTTRTILYYPLSPTLSCVVASKTYDLKSRQVPDEIVEKLNGFIAANSFQFIVGNCENTIQLAFERQRAPNQSAWVILNHLARSP